MTRTSAVLWMLATLMGLCGRPFPAPAEACDAQDPDCQDLSAPPPPRRWPIPPAAPRPVVSAWSGSIPGWDTLLGGGIRELIRFPAPGWQGSPKVFLYLHGIVVLPAQSVTCTVEMRKLDGTLLCSITTSETAPHTLLSCNVTEKIEQPVPVRVLLTTVTGGTCHMGGGWWEAPPKP